MSLANIVYPPPTPNGWKEWFFYHAQDHINIVTSIQSLKSIVLPTYVIDPMDPDDFEGWAQRHQNYHNDMNGIFGLNGIDLQEVNFDNPDEKKSWMWNNFSEHRAVHNAIGGGF